MRTTISQVKNQRVDLTDTLKNGREAVAEATSTTTAVVPKYYKSVDEIPPVLLAIDDCIQNIWQMEEWEAFGVPYIYRIRRMSMC